MLYTASLLTKRCDFKTYIYIYIWLCWVFTAVCGLYPVVVSEGYSPAAGAGFPLLLAPLAAENGLQGTRVSVVVAPGL